MPLGHGRRSPRATDGCTGASSPGSARNTARRPEGHCAVSMPSRGPGKAVVGEWAGRNLPSSPTPNACDTRTGAFAYRTDGTPLRTSTSERELTSSGRLPTPSPRCESHPWLRPRMESRMRGNSHVRFGAGDEETCPGNGARRFIPTLPKLRAALSLSLIAARCAREEIVPKVRPVDIIRVVYMAFLPGGAEEARRRIDANDLGRELHQDIGRLEGQEAGPRRNAAE